MCKIDNIDPKWIKKKEESRIIEKIHHKNVLLKIFGVYLQM